MGIKNLLTLLHERGIGRTVDPRNLIQERFHQYDEEQRKDPYSIPKTRLVRSVCVDAPSIYKFELSKAMNAQRNLDTGSVPVASASEVAAHQFLLHIALLLQYARCTVIVVFDGSPTDSKAQLDDSNRAKKERHMQQAGELTHQALQAIEGVQPASSLAQDARHDYDNLISEARYHNSRALSFRVAAQQGLARICQKMGAVVRWPRDEVLKRNEWMRSTGRQHPVFGVNPEDAEGRADADRDAHALYIQGHADIVVSNDTDYLAMGCDSVSQRIVETADGMLKLEWELFCADDLRNILPIERPEKSDVSESHLYERAAKLTFVCMGNDTTNDIPWNKPNFDISSRVSAQRLNIPDTLANITSVMKVTEKPVSTNPQPRGGRRSFMQKYAEDPQRPRYMLWPHQNFDDKLVLPYYYRSWLYYNVLQYELDYLIHCVRTRKARDWMPAVEHKHEWSLVEANSRGGNEHLYRIGSINKRFSISEDSFIDALNNCSEFPNSISEATERMWRQIIHDIKRLVRTGSMWHTLRLPEKHMATLRASTTQLMLATDFGVAELWQASIPMLALRRYYYEAREANRHGHVRFWNREQALAAMRAVLKDQSKSIGDIEARKRYNYFVEDLYPRSPEPAVAWDQRHTQPTSSMCGEDEIDSVVEDAVHNTAAHSRTVPIAIKKPRAPAEPSTNAAASYTDCGSISSGSGLGDEESYAARSSFSCRSYADSLVSLEVDDIELN